MRRSELIAWRRLAILLFFPAAADLLLEASPLRLLRVLVFLPRVAMLAAGAPFFAAPFGIARAITARLPRLITALAVPVRSRPFPAALALSPPGGFRRIARLPQLAALEPSQRGGRMFFAQAVECRQEFFDIMRTEGRRLIVHDDGPVRVSRRHSR